MRQMAQVPRTRVMLPFSGQLDANGNGTLLSPRFPGNDYYALVNIALKVLTGVATWEVYITPSNESSNLVGFVGAGVGASVGGGPYPVAPNEYVQILVTGGTPNAMVTGSIYGVQGVPLDDLPVIPSSSMLTGVAIQGSITSVENPETNLATFSIPINATTTKFVIPPVGTQVLVLNINNNPNAAFRSVEIIGHVSGAIYYFTDSTQFQFINPIVLGIDQATDNQYDIQWVYDPGTGGPDAWVIDAHTATREVISRLLLPSAQHGDIIVGADPGTNFTTGNFTTPGPNNLFGTASMLVSKAYANPAPWESPQNNAYPPLQGAPSIAAGATLTIAGASAGFSYYIHAMTAMPVDSAGWITQFQDTTGVTIAIMASSPGINWYYHDHHGLIVPVGRGLQLHNPGSNAENFYYTIDIALAPLHP